MEQVKVRRGEEGWGLSGGSLCPRPPVIYDLKTWNKSKKEEGRNVGFSGVGRIVL